jgi:hypothetical protein
MKFAVCLASLLLGPVAWADATSDRAAVESVISRLNDAVTPVSTLLTADTVDDPAPLVQLVGQNRLRAANTQPFSEVSVPRIVVHSVRFITPEVALVDASNGQYGSNMVWSVPILFVMKRQGDDWRIAAYRIIPASPPVPIFSQQLL